MGDPGEPSLGSDWYYISSTKAIRFFKDNDGFVHFSGQANGVGVVPNSSLLITMPGGYRPSHTFRFGQTPFSSSAAFFLDVNPDGTIRWAGGSAGTPTAYLDQLIYRSYS